MEEERDSVLFYIGICLLLIGSIALLYITTSVIEVVRNPAESEIVTWAISVAENQETVVWGSSGGEEFEIHANEIFQYIFLCLGGLVILRLLTSIFMTFFKEGLRLVSASRKRRLRSQRN